jgi:Fe-S cluster assembly protein SufD
MIRTSAPARIRGGGRHAAVDLDLGTVGELSRERVLRLSEALDDPEWLRERRLEAWDAYERLPVPDTRGEAWRYTDLARWPWRDARLELAGAPASEDGLGRGLARPGAASGAHALVNGAPGAQWLGAEAASQGVVFTDLLSAVRDHADLVEPHLLRVGVTPERGKLAALHCALLSGGTFLYVPPGVQLTLPLQSLRTLRRAGIAVVPHTLVVAGRGSRLTYVEESFSPTLEGPALNCAALEIVAGPDSQVQVATLQEWGRNVIHYSLQRARVQKDATASSLVATLGASLSRVEVQSVLEAEGGTSEMLGLYLGDESQHMDHNTLQLHTAPHTTSDLLFKGALRDRSRSAFSGLIKVFKGAQRTDAYQKNRNLLLSPEARADSLPNLEIEADDVRCSHGATIGQVDELQVFYLMSRGLSRPEAERLLVQGFFEEVLARVPLPGLQERIRAAVEIKTAGRGPRAVDEPSRRDGRRAAPSEAAVSGNA